MGRVSDTRRARVVLLLVVLGACALVPAVASAETDRPAVTSAQTDRPVPADAGPTVGDGPSPNSLAFDASAEASNASESEQNERNETSNASLCSSDRPTPDEDELGWEDGCWYDASLPLKSGRAINETAMTREELNETALDRAELAAVVARAKARIEVVRQLEFDGNVSVDIVSREEYGNRSHRYFANFSDQRELRENVTWESMFVVDGGANATAARQAHDAVLSPGYYDPATGEVVAVTANRNFSTVNETALATLLTYALQDQQFDLGEEFDYGRFEYRNGTIDAKNGAASVVEGDASYVAASYESRCNGDWECLQFNGTQGNVRDLNFGMRILSDQPGFDGTKLVEEAREEGGWQAVESLYENPPASSKQVIHTDEYPTGAPADLSFEDTSAGSWRPYRNDSARPAYVTLGEAGIASMFIYPFYEEQQIRSPIIPYEAHVNTVRYNQIDADDPIRYGGNVHSRGWENDRLYPYVTADSTGARETGYVWKTVWESERDGEEFVEGYLRLLSYKGAVNVTDYEDTYRIARGDDFSGAYHVETQGNAVVVTHAPTIADISQIRTDTELTRIEQDETPLSASNGALVSAVAVLSIGALVWIRRTVK